MSALGFVFLTYSLRSFVLSHGDIYFCFSVSLSLCFIGSVCCTYIPLRRLTNATTALFTIHVAFASKLVLSTFSGAHSPLAIHPNGR